MSRLRYTLLADGTSDRILIHVINWALRCLGARVQDQSYADLSSVRPKPRGLAERAVPVLSLRIPSAKIAAAAGAPVVLSGYPAAVTNRTFGLRLRADKRDLFTEGPVPVRLVLLAEGQEVGRAGMAVDAHLDRATGTVTADFGKEINVAMILTSDRLSTGDRVTTVRIVAQDPATDAILGQSEDLPVKLGI